MCFRTCDNDSNDEDYQPPDRNGTSSAPGFKRENGHGASKGKIEVTDRLLYSLWHFRD